MTEPIPSPYANFERIPAEEQQRILEACIEEFAQNGYEAASTNAIVKRAGIPKGTLFYFFGSKKDLYLYVIDHAVSRFVSAFEQIHVGDVHRPVRAPDPAWERPHAVRGPEPPAEPLFYRAFINAPDEIQAELQKRSPPTPGEPAPPDRRPGSFQIGKAWRSTRPSNWSIGSSKASTAATARIPALIPAEALKLVEKITAETHLYFEMLKKGVYKNL